MSCGVGRRHRWDPMLLWLWRRLAATASIKQAWEPPYATGAALENTKKKKKKKPKQNPIGIDHLAISC